MRSHTVIIAIFIIVIIVIANGIRIITIGITATTEVIRESGHASALLSLNR
jgi:hypothetical protein